MKAFYANGKVNLWQADVLDWSLWYRGEIEAGRAQPMHAIVTDPPYGLSDPPPIEDVLTAWLAGDRYEYNKGGMMSLKWDSLPPGPQIWRALLNIVYPGGYLFCFSGTRTADLLGIACRLGGWEPFDRIMHWHYSSGFPKSLAIDKALDKENDKPAPDDSFRAYLRDAIKAKGLTQKQVDKHCGTNGMVGHWVGVSQPEYPTLEKWAILKTLLDLDDSMDYLIEWAEAEREVIGKHQAPAKSIYSQGQNELDQDVNITTPTTPLAQAFDGFGTSLKPAGEPILLFRRPREGRTFAQCAREFGSGGLWVDGCRVGSVVETWPTSRSYAPGSFEPGYSGDKQKTNEAPAGRWPPNVAFTHVPPTLCPTCNGAGCDDCHGEGVTGGCRRVGSKRVRGDKRDGSITDTPARSWANMSKSGIARQGHADPDGLETIADWECVEGCAVAALDEMAGERKSGVAIRHNVGVSGKGWKSVAYTNTRDDFGYGDSGSNASRFYPCHDWFLEIAERLAGETPYAYVPKASRGERDAGLGEFPAVECQQGCGGNFPVDDQGNVRDRFKVIARNTHACVKPLSLIKWLATLCRPPAQFSPRICVPFAGSGSEAIGAVLAGWTEIHAIERELEYCEIAAARIAWWSKWAKLTGKTDPAEIRKLGEAAEAKEAWRGDERQTTMWELLE